LRTHSDTIADTRGSHLLRWDPYFGLGGNDMEFRLTYAGRLLAHRDDGRLPQRKLHVHDIRREFHKQLNALWDDHPVLRALKNKPCAYHKAPRPGVMHVFKHAGFNWLPIVTEANGLICKIDILMLRAGEPGKVLWDIDNRIKTVFDALRKAKGP